MNRACVICVIDDDENDRFFLKRALNAAGIEAVVKEFDDAETAWHYLKGDDPYQDRAANPLPDVIISDSALENASGLDLLQWVRVHPKFQHLPFIVYSGSSAPSLLEEAMRHGVTAVLSKGIGNAAAAAREMVSYFPSHCQRRDKAEDGSA